MSTNQSPLKNGILHTTGEYYGYPEFRQYLLALDDQRFAEIQAERERKENAWNDVLAACERGEKPQFDWEQMNAQYKAQKAAINAKYEALAIQAHEHFGVSRINDLEKVIAAGTTTALYVDERRSIQKEFRKEARLEAQEDGTWLLTLVTRQSLTREELVTGVRRHALSSLSWRAAEATPQQEDAAQSTRR